MQYLVGLIPLGLGLAALISTYQIGIGKLNKPEAGFWPFIISCILVCISILILVKDAKKGSIESFTPKSKKIIYSIFSIAAFIVLFKFMGLLVAVPALLIYQLKYLGGETWKMSVILTAGITVVVYFLFSVWLKIPFPGYLS